MKLTQAQLKEFLSYDPVSGVMRWLVCLSNAAPVGSEVRGKTVRGYRRVQINKIRYKAHDLAWLYVTGEWPQKLIDHIDRTPENIAFANLREASQMQNCHNRSVNRNNTSGVKGVYWNKKERKWVARVGFAGTRVPVGSFIDLDSAIVAIQKVREQLHGEFATHYG